MAESKVEPLCDDVTIALDDESLTDFVAPEESIGELKKAMAGLRAEVKSLKSSQTELETKVERLSDFEADTRWKQATKGVYPSARRDSTVVDEYKSAATGETVKVKDPFRFLENPDSEETKEWVDAQCSLLRGYFRQCPHRAAIGKRVEELINYERITCPTLKGDRRIFFKHNTGLQNQSVLFVNDGSEFSAESKRMLLDANSLSEDGTTSLQSVSTSDDSNLLAYSLTRSGSDWSEFHVMDVSNGDVFPETLKWTKFTTVAWTHDNKGFFYNRYAQPSKFEVAGDEDFKRGKDTEKLTNQMLYYHRVGTAQSEDILLTDATELGGESWFLQPRMSDCGQTLVLSMAPTCDPLNRVFLVTLTDLRLDDASANHRSLFNANVLKLVDSFDYGFVYITNTADTFYFLTNLDADFYRVVSVDASKFSASTPVSWTEVVAESKYRLSYSICVNGMILLNYTEDAKDVVKLVSLKGAAIAGDNIMASLPPAGAIEFSGRHDSALGFFRFESFCVPPQIYSYNYETHEMKLVWETPLAGFGEVSLSDLFETKQVFVTSKDGTRVPMFVMARKGLVLDGNNPTVMYGYGGFDISLLPYFSVKRLIWLHNFGGVYAVANLRGGGEYGESWHQSGTRDKKQNVFDDFHSCAQWLIDAKYTSAKKLAIEGGSNGGLLVAACCNQRPELYRAGVAQVGVLDMLRFHKFTVGYAWVSDYGSADEDGFDYLYAYSPLHNLAALKSSPTQYPSFLATCGDHDDRVVPLHSEKFVATLQCGLGRMGKQKNPLLIRVELKAGHCGSSLRKSIDLIQDCYTFLERELAAKWSP